MSARIGQGQSCREETGKCKAPCTRHETTGKANALVEQFRHKPYACTHKLDLSGDGLLLVLVHQLHQGLVGEHVALVLLFVDQEAEESGVDHRVQHHHEHAGDQIRLQKDGLTRKRHQEIHRYQSHDMRTKGVIERHRSIDRMNGNARESRESV